MNQIKVISFWGSESNSIANPETAGYGYFPPRGACLLQLPNDHEIMVELEDMSCGNYGSRRFWAVEDLSTGYTWKWAEGTMDDCSISPDWYIDQIYHSIASALHIEAFDIMDLAYDAIDLAAYRIAKENL